MSEIVIPYSPRKLQKFLHTQIPKSRFNVIVAHRRSGKTVMCINHMIRDALTKWKATHLLPKYSNKQQVKHSFNAETPLVVKWEKSQ